MKVFKAVFKIFAVLLSLFAVTFTVYWFNADMKLIRFVYEKLQPHYDNLKKDKIL